MRRFLTVLAILFLVALVSAEEATIDRFEKVVHRMVKAINEADYAKIRRDFGKAMLDTLPLEQSESFFKNPSAQYGKIQKLGSAQLTPPNQAIFPAHCERGILDIKIVLDNQDKIIGLWFLPHIPGNATADANSIADANTVAEPNAVVDANAVADANAVEVKWSEELEYALGRINRGGEKEIHVWLRGEIEDKSRLARTVQEQITAELNFIRELAVEEGAVKTTEGIDRLLASRNERFEELSKRIDEERKRERLREREERRGRDREQRRRDREDRRPRERPPRRP